MTGVAPDLARASAMLDVKRYSQAASLLAVVVAADPENGRAWCLLAAAHLGNGLYQEAAAAATRAITLAPSDDWPYRLASFAQMHLGNITAARTAATEACNLAPHNWQAHLCLAQAELAGYVKFNAWEQGAGPAQQAIASALRLAPDEPDVHVVAGQVSFARGRSAAARNHQERALALNPAHSGALNELGRIKARHFAHAQAARHFMHAAQSAPEISVYGQNVDTTVRRVVNLTIYGAATAGIVLSFLTSYTRLGRGPLLIGYVAIIMLSAGFFAVQLQRMPPAARQLFRTRRIALALATACGAILIAMIVAAVTPVGALPTAVPAVTLLIVASRFIAAAILPRKKSSTVDHQRTG